MGGSGSHGGFATLTHARLRAAQGDIAGAARIVRVILESQPGHTEAREFLDSLDGRIPVTYREKPEAPLAAARPAVAEELRGSFRSAIDGVGARARLEEWLRRVCANRGERRAR